MGEFIVKKQVFFKKVAAGLCATFFGASSMVASAKESQFGGNEKFYTCNKAILEHTHSKKLILLYHQELNGGRWWIRTTEA